MAAPTIRGVTTPIITTGAINQPSATQIGDLVIFWLWSQAGDSTTVTHTKNADVSYVTIRTAPHEDGTTDGRLSVAYRIATQAGTVAITPYTVANATANQTTGGAIALNVGTFDVSSAPPNNGATLTTNAVPNPPSLTGLTGDYLICALSAWHVTTAGATAATVMANYALQTQNANTSHVTHTALATRAMTGLSNATEDPAAWGDNVTPNGSISFTFAIKGPPAPIDGSASVTDAADTKTITGAVATAGASSATDAGDTQAGAGAVAVAGATTGSDAADSVSAAGTVEDAGTSGTAAIADAADSSAAGGTVAVAGAASGTDAADSGTRAGSVATSGAGSSSDAVDSGSAAGAVAIAASAGASDAADTRTAAGAVAVSGTATAQDGADSITAYDAQQQYTAPTHCWSSYEAKRRQVASSRRRRG